MSKRLTPDIAIIGAGSGGLSMAVTARAFGLDVVLIEKDKMGGDCLNTGCVPSKAMIAAAKYAHTASTASDFGIEIRDIKVDYEKLHSHIHDVIKQIEPNDSIERFEGLGVKIIQAEAHFKDEKTLIAGEYEINAFRFVIASGSSPFTPPIKGLDNVSYLTNENFFDIKQAPERLAIIGGGPIGVEMAQAQNRLGIEVHLFQKGSILPKEEPVHVQIIRNILIKEGVHLYEHVDISCINKPTEGKDNVEIHYSQKGEKYCSAASHLLIATGRKPNLESLHLTNAKVDFDQKGIQVNGMMRTSNKRIYAIGDVNGLMQFTHSASAQTGIAFAHMFFRISQKFNPDLIPRVTYTHPEIAAIGIGEAQALKHYTREKLKILTFPYNDNDRAIAERKIAGQIKVIIDKKGRILGVHIIGEQAGELIQPWASAMANRLKIGAMFKYISPYPTLSEINKRVATKAYETLPQKAVIRFIINLLKKLG